MISENELLFLCTKKDFQLEHQEQVINLCSKIIINWNTVYLTALHHKVAPLIYYNLSKCGNLIAKINPENLKNFKYYFLNAHLYKTQQEQDITNTLLYFNQKSVKVMLIKGAALNLTIYKDCPWYVIGDIDIILNNKREEVTDKEDQEDIKFFESLKINEWERFEHHDVSMNTALPINFAQIFERAIEINFQGQKVLIMSPEDMLLAACINSCRKRFFRLKSLLDITTIIDYYKAFNWQQFIIISKEYKCSSIVYTSLLVTSLTLGYKISEDVLDNLDINPLKKIITRQLIEYLITNIPLFFLLPSSGINILGKKINPSLILKLVNSV